MKTQIIMFGIVTTLFLTACGSKPEIPTGAPVIPVVNYPTSQEETPATKYCASQGGVVSVEKTGTGGIEVAYCTLKTGEKVDAWKYMSEGTSEAPKAESMIEVKGTVAYTEHNTQSDCYTQINGKVYDITGMFGKHKGGDEALIGLCGKDGTEMFTKMHGGKEKPNQVLESFEVK